MWLTDRGRSIRGRSVRGRRRKFLVFISGEIKTIQTNKQQTMPGRITFASIKFYISNVFYSVTNTDYMHGRYLWQMRLVFSEIPLLFESLLRPLHF